MKKKTLLSWSSGKDCAWALHLLRQDPAVELAGLFTVMNERFDRVPMHGTRAALLRLQAAAAGLPLQTIDIPDQCPHEEYAARMQAFIDGALAAGVESIAFGDLYLEEVRQYREDRLRGTGIEPVFPVWGIPTDQLAGQMLDAGVEAYVSSVDLKQLPAACAGRRWSRQLLAEFPAGTDPCGENGEIHTVVVGGPMFTRPIPVVVGEVVERGGFAYADLLPAGGPS